MGIATLVKVQSSGPLVFVYHCFRNPRQHRYAVDHRIWGKNILKVCQSYRVDAGGLRGTKGGRPERNLVVGERRSQPCRRIILIGVIDSRWWPEAAVGINSGKRRKVPASYRNGWCLRKSHVSLTNPEALIVDEEEQLIFFDWSSYRASELVLLIIWQLQASEIREEIRRVEII